MVKTRRPFAVFLQAPAFLPLLPSDYPMERLKMRRTVKKGLLGAELKPNDADALTKAIGHDIVYFSRSSKHAQCIEEAQVEAYRIQTHRQEAAKELSAWLRLSNDEAEKHRDGLTTEGLEIGGVKGWYIRNFMSPEDMMSSFSKKMSIAMNEELVRQGPGWIVITSKGRQGKRNKALLFDAQCISEIVLYVKF